jgi:hypothetical protein
MNRIIPVMAIMMAYLGACTKQEKVQIDGNEPPDYSGVPTIMVENYVNRLYIDLLGREATNEERKLFTDSLKNNNLDTSIRKRIIQTLQYETLYREGDSSYRHAWHERTYNLAKARFIDGADDAEMSQTIGNARFAKKIARLEGDSVRVFSAQGTIDRMEKVIFSKYRLNMGYIDYGQMCAVMLDNSIFDLINMNSFNFVNASFDAVLGRNPTQQELKQGLDIIDANKPTAFLQSWASNKTEYCNVLTTSNEFYEAQIRWMFYVLLRREAKTIEVSNIFKTYSKTRMLQDIQLPICLSDEYAQFR